MKRSLTLALSLFVGGCAAFTSGSGAGSPQNALTIQVKSEPPADKEDDARPSTPGYGFIWANGYWDYLDGNYIWRTGRWVQSKPDFEYQRARYEYDGKIWVFHRPHWKKRHAATAAQTEPKS